MPKTRRRNRKPEAREIERLVAELPARLTNPNGCTSWQTVDEYQRAVADYLRSIPANERFAVEVARATGVGVCIVVNNRLTRSALQPTGEPKHAT